MIFVTLGSKKFQINRLLTEIDKLIEEGNIEEAVFDQIGYSDYKPKNYKYKEFLDRDEFSSVMKKCDKVITHGGTGAIISAIKQGKKVIAIPRLKKFDEHIDDHQLQIVEEFKKMNFIESTIDVKYLNELLNRLKEFNPRSYISNTRNIAESIVNFIDGI